VIDREYLEDNIRRLVKKPWISEQDLSYIHSILVILPFTRGTLSQMLQQIAEDIEIDLQQLVIKEGTSGREGSSQPPQG